MDEWASRCAGTRPELNQEFRSEKRLMAELAAVAAAAAVNSVPDLTARAETARQAGATPGQVQAAIGIAAAIKRTAGQKVEAAIGRSTAAAESCCGPDRGAFRGTYNKGRETIEALVMTDGARLQFDAIYKEFHPRILRYLARLIGFDEAEDAAQEVFAKVSRALPDFRNESQLSTWIYRIATNTATDRVRSPEYRLTLRSSPLESGGECEPAGAAVASPGCSAERQTIRAEMSGCVQGLLTELPEDYRTVLVLSEMEELKDREIAEVLGLTLEAVKIRLHRARAKLRQSVEKQCSFYRDPENRLLCDIKLLPPKP